MWIIIALLVIFLLAIAVVLGILFFRRHQSRNNRGKFHESFAYLQYIYIYFFFFFFFFLNLFFNMMSRISKHKVEFYSLVWYSALLSWCEAFSFFTRLVLPSNGIIFMTECILFTLVPYLYPPPPGEISVFKNGMTECATVSHFAGSFAFLQMLFWLYLDPLCLS